MGYRGIPSKLEHHLFFFFFLTLFHIFQYSSLTLNSVAETVSELTLMLHLPSAGLMGLTDVSHHAQQHHFVSSSVKLDKDLVGLLILCSSCVVVRFAWEGAE